MAILLRYLLTMQSFGKLISSELVAKLDIDKLQQTLMSHWINYIYS